VLFIVFLIWPGPKSEPMFPLGSMVFNYDPLGGEPGGGDAGPMEEGDAQGPPPAPSPDTPVPEEELEPQMIQEQDLEPFPEPDIIEAEDLTILESLSAQAEEIALPAPPPPEEKPKPKQRKPKPPPPKPTLSPGIQEGGQGTIEGATGPGSGGGTGTGTGGGEGTGLGGSGGGTGRGTANALEAYKNRVRQKIIRYRRYPNSARNNQIEGTATMRFTLNRQGQVTSARLVSSSGSPALDDEAQALIQRVNPLPTFPKELTQNTLTLTVPIQFKIR
jgi:protein TonB